MVDVSGRAVIVRGVLRVFVVAMMLAGTVAYAAEPSVSRVESVPDLKPLSMTAVGRMMKDPSSDGAAGEAMLQAQWPGAYFEAAFQGTEVYFRVGKAHEILHVSVDGGPAVKVIDPGPGEYRIAGLANKQHVVRVAVVTESQSAPNEFGGFGLPKRERALPPPPMRLRQIEFVGDSHTVGYGNTSATQTCTNDEVWATTDTSQTFGPLVAAHYNADFQVNAISGHGVVRNYNGSAGDPVPVAYPYVLLDKKQTYNDAAWQPQVVVISLGTNDFSTPLHDGEPWKTREELHADYDKTYVRFLQRLRARDPKALIVLWATEMANGEIESEVKKVADEAHALGDTRVVFAPVDGLTFSGCHSHPSVADDRVIAEVLEKAIDGTEDVWQGK